MKISSGEKISYNEYLKNLSIDELNDVLRKIDKDKYKEKHALILKQLEIKKIAYHDIENKICIKAWLLNFSILKLTIYYFVLMVAIVLISIIAFFFPIMPLSYILGFEVSNLGPIATAAWGLSFDIFVVTPIFLIFAIIKIFKCRNKY